MSFITVRNATANNLKGVSADIPTGALTCCIGRSGSGKSSFAIEVLFRGCVEPERWQMENENVVSGRVPAVAVMQRHQVIGRMVSVARYIGISDYLLSAIRDSRECTKCAGKGILTRLLPDRAVINPSQPITSTGLHPLLRPALPAIKTSLRDYSGAIVLDKLTGSSRDQFLFGGKNNAAWRGLEHELLDAAEQGLLTISERDLQAFFFSALTCPLCAGMGVLAAKNDIKTGCDGFAASFPLGMCWGPYVMSDRLPLGRPLARLSLGQFQWARTLRAIRDAKPGMLVLLDEPGAGMCKRDILNVVALCRDLVAMGRCTVVMIEHSPLAILHADHILEFGPGGGTEGGQITFSGSCRDFLRRDSGFPAMVIDLVKRIDPPSENTKTSLLRVGGIEEYGLQGVELRIPIQKWTCIAGPIGVGKSGAVDATFRAMDKSAGAWVGRIGIGLVEGRDKIRRPHLVDQKPIGINPHSIPLTYIDAMTALRTCFCEIAADDGLAFGVEYFSFNTVAGQCGGCEGRGHVEKVISEHSFWNKCPKCEGARYREDVLSVKHRGRSIGDILQMTVKDARALLQKDDLLSRKLGFLEKVGLGYMMLGEPSNSLSGGEAQRVKIARELSKRLGDRTLYLLDNPSRGLSLWDADYMVGVFKELVVRNTVVIADNHPRFVSECDWLIVLDATNKGTSVTFAGPPLKAPPALIESITGLGAIEALLKTGGAKRA